MSTTNFNYSYTWQAAAAGDLDQLKAMLADGYALNNDIGNTAGISGNIEILEFLHNYEGGSKLNELSFLSAVENNHIDAVDWFLKNNFPWPKNTILYCIVYCDLYIIKKIISKGCPIDAEAAHTAALYGKLPILKYLHRYHNVPLSGFSDKQITDYSELRDENDRHVFNAAVSAATQGNFKCLKYAFENGCKFLPSTTWYIASQLGQFEDESDFTINQIFKCLEFVVDNGCLIDKDTSFTAFANGDIRLLRFIQSKGALKIDKEILELLEENQSEEILEFIREAITKKHLENCEVRSDLVKYVINRFM